MALKTVGLALWREEKRGRRGLIFLEKPHVPLQGLVSVFAQHRLKGVFAAGFEFDEVLDLAVGSEADRRARVSPYGPLRRSGTEC